VDDLTIALMRIEHICIAGPYQAVSWSTVSTVPFDHFLSALAKERNPSIKIAIHIHLQEPIIFIFYMIVKSLTRSWTYY
jgi:hypothetical protein